jgi:hypothetical protein
MIPFWLMPFLWKKSGTEKYLAISIR